MNLRQLSISVPRSNRILATENRQTYSVWELNMEEVKRKDAKKDKKLLRHGKDMELLCQGPYTLHEGSKSANVLVIHGDGIVVSYYKPTDGSSRGSITVTDIQSGQIVCDIVDNVTPGPMANIEQIVDSICTMYYDEEKENLYTGTIDGAFQIWGA